MEPLNSNAGRDCQVYKSGQKKEDLLVVAVTPQRESDNTQRWGGALTLTRHGTAAGFRPVSWKLSTWESVPAHRRIRHGSLES